MRVGPFELRRPRTVTAAAKPAPKKAPSTVGASGTVDYDGFLTSDEYNPDLRGKQALDVYDKMLRSDGSVQEAVEHIFSPIKNATVTVEPPEAPTPEELVAAALVRDAFFETLNQPFVEYLDQALDYLAFGHQVFETSWQVVERELSYEVPGEFDTDPATGARTPHKETVPKAQYLVWDRFEQRLQSTIIRWIQKGGKLLQIQQITWKDTSYVEPIIDASQLLVLINKRRGDQFTGRSILRAAYKPWFLKEIVEKIEVVSLERWGCNIVVGYLPQSQRDDAAALTRLEEILENLKAGESTYVAFPGPKQGAGPNGAEGYLIELIGPTGTPPDFQGAKQYHRAEIKAAVLARFAELGHAQTGARSTGDTQSKVWYDALHAVARYLEVAHEPAIRRLVDANLTGVERYPRLAFSGIEARDLNEFATAVSSLVGSTAIKADATFRGWVREEIDAPPEDEVDDSEPADPLADPNAQPDPLERRRNGGDPKLAPVEAE
jgi:hypothetical protein